MNPVAAGGVTLAAGAALSLAFPAPDLAPVAWVAVAPLLILAARGGSLARGFGLGVLYGIGFFGALLIWIHYVGWVAWAVLVVVQACFVGLFGAAWSRASRWRPIAARVVLAATLWVGVEYIRSVVPLGGFSWGQLAQSQHDLTWMLRPAALGGGWLVAFVVMIVNALVAEAWRARETVRTTAALVGIGAAALVVPAALPSQHAGGREIRVAIVQGNVPRAFSGSLFEKELAIVRSHARLTEELPGSVDLVVWPESSVGLDLERVADAAAEVASAARTVGAPMIVGGNLDVDADRYLVMAFQVAPTGEVVDRYQKTHLVPFGEYVPARSLLDWIPMLDQIPRDAIAGDQPTVFEVAGGRVAPVISYEGDFGPLVRDRIDAGGRLLVVATNTSTWGESWASAQHVAFSQVRAAENGVWVVHAAISGISAFVAPDGSVVDATDLWTRSSLVETVRFVGDVTFYARTGDWFPLLCIALAAVGVATAGGSFVRRSKRSSSA